MQPRQAGQHPDAHDRGEDAVDERANPLRAHGAQRQDGDAEQRDDARRLADGALGTLRPQRAQRRPGRERGQESQRREPGAPHPPLGKDAKRRADQDDPPDPDARLAADDDVVAAALEA